MEKTHQKPSRLIKELKNAINTNKNNQKLAWLNGSKNETIKLIPKKPKLAIIKAIL